MKTLHFSTMIGAPRTRVWQNMLGEQTYKVWTAAFGETFFEGSWTAGATMRADNRWR